MSNELSLSDFSENIQKGFKEYDLNKGWITTEDGNKAFIGGDGKPKFTKEEIAKETSKKDSSSSKSKGYDESASKATDLELKDKSLDEINELAKKVNPIFKHSDEYLNAIYAQYNDADLQTKESSEYKKTKNMTKKEHKIYDEMQKLMGRGAFQIIDDIKQYFKLVPSKDRVQYGEVLLMLKKNAISRK